MKKDRMYKVVSDGTIDNTFVYDPDGNVVEGVTNFGIVGNAHFERLDLELTIQNVLVDIKIPEDEVAIIEATKVEVE